MVFKRSRFYHYRFLFEGKPIQRSTRQADRDAAKKMEAAERTRLALEAAGLESPVSPITKQQYVTIGSLVDALEADYRLRNKMSPQNISNLKRVRKDFGSIRARDLTAEDIDAYVQKRLVAGARPATVNRITQLLGQALKLAIERHHITRAPKIRRLSEKGNERVGFFSDAEFHAVLENLPDDGLQDFVTFCFLSAWRKGEAAALTWQNVEEGVIRLPGEDSKNGEGRVIVIDGQLVELIERRRKARLVDGVLTNLLFHRDGRPVSGFRKSWHTACEKAGVPGRIFHDLRRTAIRNLVRAGVSEKVAMTISGHKTRSVFDRYNVSSERDLRDAMQRVARYHQAQQ